jgi:hypothetical protein
MHSEKNGSSHQAPTVPTEKVCEIERCKLHFTWMVTREHFMALACHICFRERSVKHQTRPLCRLLPDLNTDTPADQLVYVQKIPELTRFTSLSWHSQHRPLHVPSLLIKRKTARIYVQVVTQDSYHTPSPLWTRLYSRASCNCETFTFSHHAVLSYDRTRASCKASSP